MRRRLWTFPLSRVECIQEAEEGETAAGRKGSGPGISSVYFPCIRDVLEDASGPRSEAKREHRGPWQLWAALGMAMGVLRSRGMGGHRGAGVLSHGPALSGKKKDISSNYHLQYAFQGLNGVF